MNIADINLETRTLCDADSTSYPDATLLRRTNNAYEEIVGDIIAADGTWQFDDTNYSDLPIATTNLIAGQQDYAFNTTFLEIERLEVLDNNGIWRTLDPIDKSEITDIALPEYQKVNQLPREYDKQGGSVFLYPAPAAANVTLTAGLKAYFKRTAQIYTSAEVTTGTKNPGFASPYHVILCYKAALPYCMTYKKDRVALYANEITRLHKELMAFYGLREQDKRKVMSMKPIYFR